MKIKIIILEDGEELLVAFKGKHVMQYYEYALPTLRIDSVGNKHIRLVTWNGLKLENFVTEDPYPQSEVDTTTFDAPPNWRNK